MIEDQTVNTILNPEFTSNRATGSQFASLPSISSRDYRTRRTTPFHRSIDPFLLPALPIFPRSVLSRPPGRLKLADEQVPFEMPHFYSQVTARGELRFSKPLHCQAFVRASRFQTSPCARMTRRSSSRTWFEISGCCRRDMPSLASLRLPGAPLPSS